MNRLLRRYAVEIAMVMAMAIIGICIVGGTEPARSRDGMGLYGSVRG